MVCFSFCFVRGLVVVAIIATAALTTTPHVAHAADSITAILAEDPVATVSANMASFSFEVSGILGMMGKSPDPPKTSFVQLFRNLQEKSGKEGPNIRIGGNSADESWWNPDGKPRPAGISYDISYTDLQSYANFVQATGNTTTLVIDTNMRQPNSSSWAVAHVNAAANFLGWDTIKAVEIGNENDLFYENGIRPLNYTYDEYQNELRLYLQGLYSAGTPSHKIQGGTFCCHWDGDVDTDIKTFARNFKTYSFHRYPTSHCNGHTPKLTDLLADEAAKGQADMVKGWAQTSRENNVTFVIGEGNSCSCGGLMNMSNTMASAVWSMDFLFNIAAVNVSLMNFHGGGDGAYTAIGYASSNATVPDVRPLYYSMLAFTEATRNGSVIQNIQVSSTNDYLKMWAVKDASGGWRVVVISKIFNTTELSSVSVNISHVKQVTSGTLYTLKSKGGSIYDTYGLTWAEQTFDGSQDGKPIGTHTGTQLTPKSPGVFEFQIAPASIAVLEF